MGCHVLAILLALMRISRVVTHAASNDENWALEGVLDASETAQSDQFSRSDRLASSCCYRENRWIEITWSEEVGLNTASISGRKVPNWVAGEGRNILGRNKVASQLKIWWERGVL